MFIKYIYIYIYIYFFFFFFFFKKKNTLYLLYLSIYIYIEKMKGINIFFRFFIILFFIIFPSYYGIRLFILFSIKKISK